MEERRSDLLLGVSEVASETLRVPVGELPPLANSVDPDALTALVSPLGYLQRSDVRVTFEYADLEFVVQTGPMVFASPIGTTWDGSVRGRVFEG